MNTLLNSEKIGYEPLVLSEELATKLELHNKITFRNLLKCLAIVLVSIFICLVIIWACNFKGKSVLVIILIVSYLTVMLNCFINDVYSQVEKYVQEIIKKRMKNKIELNSFWNDEDLTMVKKIISICIEKLDWAPNTIFLPEDSFALMIALYTDDLETECIIAIEDEFSFEFDDSFFQEKKFCNLKFKDIVDYIKKTQSIITL